MIKHAYSWVGGLLTAFAVLVALSLPGYAVKVEKLLVLVVSKLGWCATTVLR